MDGERYLLVSSVEVSVNPARAKVRRAGYCRESNNDHGAWSPPNEVAMERSEP
jgi:hypothetical protein